TFAGADADAVFERQDENFAVADSAVRRGLGRLGDCQDRRFDERIIHGDFELELGQEPDLELLAPIDFGEAALPATAAYLADGHQVYFAFGEHFLDRLQPLG